jgi:1-acyl-sn-glycerol-3-phosphate acyltransferase
LLGIQPAIAVAAALNLLALLAALPTRFDSDIRRTETPMQALVGFFRDSKRIVADTQARSALLGLAVCVGLLTITIATLAAQENAVLQLLVHVSLGAALGSLLAGLQGHPGRALGLVSLGATAFLAVLGWALVACNLSWPAFCLGIFGGLIIVPLRTAYVAAAPADGRGNGMAVMNAANYVCGSILAITLLPLRRLEILSPSGQLIALAILTAAGVVVAWRLLFRDILEQLVEWLIWPMYRIKGAGPGIQELPERGPLLIVVNHTAWFDPLWLAKVITRRLTPMMTSRFYDRPILHWLMTRVVHAIRVPMGKIRRDPPEIGEAVAALDRGEAVAIFPEGYVKRRADVPLKQFGQGVWRILSQRPQTPVVACWLEGGWGSYASYCNGPPMVNKKLDWWRPIAVGVSAPQVLPAELLADQRATRRYLMQCCLEARTHLGLEVLTLQDVGEKEDEETAY